MKGTIPKHSAGRVLSCQRCQFFRDDDEDIYYCELEQPEFPKMCSEFISTKEDKVIDE